MTTAVLLRDTRAMSKWMYSRRCFEETNWFKYLMAFSNSVPSMDSWTRRSFFLIKLKTMMGDPNRLRSLLKCSPGTGEERVTRRTDR